MMTQKLGNGFEFIKKACFVCRSFNHLNKDCDFHDNKMVEKPVLNNKGRVTGQREFRPVWNNAQRVNHQNKLTQPHPKRNFVQIAVATKSGKVPVNAAKQNSLRAAVSISTARPVKTVAPKSKVNDAFPKTYSYFKTARVNNVTTAGLKAVVSVAVGNRENVVKSSACWIWRPIGNVIDHTSKDSGSYLFKRFDYVVLQGKLNRCSRHMTGNKSFPTDYQEIDGGFVAFGGSPKGGKITGKGKIRTGKLDFEDVYFVKELKFNLFSFSQMCDKKNSVLFTKTECLVLSSDFKLLDESQVLLKVPRHNNMYSFDLKNVVPLGGLTCLFVKATIDESNLWHRRLGHINFKTMKKLMRGNLVRVLPSNLFENDHTCVVCKKGKQHKASCKTKLVFFLATKDETSEILKTFITGIENQINHKIKIIRYDNGIEFKNNDMNQFCGMKGIKREFCVARTPQQNGVAERKNRTLIKAAKTMLADSLLPTTFWAEKVSNACYVQNRVLVTKPHIKTPYELLHGRPPSISFMKPFGCLVAILNTLDPLGKFDGKTDEGFFVGYSINSKAFRPVTAGNQTNRNACIKEYVDAVPTQQYIMLPFLPDSLQSLEDVVADDAGKKITEELVNKGERNGQEKEGEALNKEGGQHVQDLRAELDKLLVQQKEDYANSTNRVSTVSPSVSVAGKSFVNDLLTDPLMPDLEDTTDLLNMVPYDDEDVGAEADLNNLETTMNVGPIPTTISHKDHLKDQIIGDINSATQTKRITKIFEEHAMVEKALYGLHKLLNLVMRPYLPTLLENGFRRGVIDKTLFIKKDKGDIMLVHVYVDDIIFGSTKKSLVNDIIFGSTKKSLCVKFEQMMHKRFQMSHNDYAGASLDRKSTIGGCQFLSKRLISWQCKKKIVLANSTTEAEYVATANCCGQVLWIQNQMLDYGFTFMNTKIYIDNESTICIVKNLVFDSKTKHIEIRHHFIRDSYKKKLIQVIKIYTDHNVADLLTKAFDVSRKAKRTTKISQSIRPIHLDADETVYKEWEDIMERVVTTASSLEAEQDSEAQTRFEAASKQSNDPPHLRVNTHGSGEDSMKLKELMELCTKLSKRILDNKNR
ncbi:putative ribonuclease H-like domain-containing protein [Tanacetum coccineum]